MEETAIKAMQRRHFIETSAALIDWWIDTFPDTSAAIREEKIKLAGVVRNNAARERECLQTWHDGMSMPLDARRVKYAPALKRITGVDGTVYHACDYRDLKGLLESTEGFDLLQSLEIEQNLEARPDCKDQMWELVTQLNRYALQYFEVSNTLPSREEIQENIRMHKASKMPAKPAMIRGFETTFDDLVSKLGGEGVDASVVSGCWAEAMKSHDLSGICARRDVEGLRSVKFDDADVDRLFATSDASAFDDGVWELIGQLNSFTSVHSSIPNKMMGRIESCAHKLAGEIACGKTDFNSLNLAAIGQSVLDGVDTEDMEAFTSNMGSLLPVLQNLQQNVGNMGGLPPVHNS